LEKITHKQSSIIDIFSSLMESISLPDVRKQCFQNRFVNEKDQKCLFRMKIGLIQIIYAAYDFCITSASKIEDSGHKMMFFIRCLTGVGLESSYGSMNYIPLCGINRSPIILN